MFLSENLPGMNTRLLLCTFLLLLSILSVGQESKEDSIQRKKITITRFSDAPKIDGILDDAVWQQAAIAKDFIQRFPTNGIPEPDSLKTQVKIGYDDTGIYVGAILYDTHPDKILKELTERDNIGNDDYFFIALNGYNDKQQSFGFFVTAAGVQIDMKISNNGDDTSWNAVWYSAVEILDNGWSVEMKIPYRELRFPDKKIQEWGVNIGRQVRRTRTQYTWNFVDNDKNSFTLFDGILNGIEDIKPPLRLSFYPYVSTYVNRFDGETDTSINGGMDVKLGLSEAFTLDMTLIPDFGQASFDRKVLNLGPFEQFFNEQRAFFTEGTELFNKGGLFYSRRVGGAPSTYPTTNENEVVEEYPSKVDLLNATKVTGRTNKGLGVGVFYSLTKKAYATIRDTLTQTTRKEEVEPLTNYNVISLDQRFGGNSSVSLVNTHVYRNKKYRNSNVTGIYWDLVNKANKYSLYGGYEGSYVYGNQEKYGSEFSAGLGKINGKHRFQLSTFLRTADYDINDLGYTGSTNYISYYGYYGYRILEPKGIYNNIFLNFNLSHSRRLNPDLFRNINFNFNSSFTTKNFLSYGGGLEVSPIGTNDIYEPRTQGRYLKVPGYVNPWIWLSTDYSKKFAFDFNIDQYFYFNQARVNYFYSLSPRYRVSDKLSFSVDFSYNYRKNDVGYVTREDDQIIMGQRDVKTNNNNFNFKYTFNNKMALQLTLRNYYSQVNYSQFYALADNGDLDNTNYSNENDNTFNSWNFDLRYSWWIAPGSELTILYRNNADIFKYEDLKKGYINNVQDLLDNPKNNNLSLRLVYFIDYNRIKNWL